MMHFRFLGDVATQAFFYLAVRFGLPFVLPQMFRPRMHQKYLDVAIRRLGVTVHSPPVCSIAKSYAAIFMDRFHELCHLFVHDNVFNRDQHRSPLQLRPNLLHNHRHPPVVPRAQVRGRIRKPRHQRQPCCTDCPDPRINKCSADPALCATAPQAALPIAKLPIYTSTKIESTRALTQSGARFWTSALISEINVTQAAPPTSITGASVLTLCKPPTATVVRPRTTMPVETTASVDHLVRAVCNNRAPTTAPTPRHPSNRP